MEVDYALLAAFADLAPDGKVSIFHGGLDTIHLPQAGRLGTPLYLAFRLSFPAEESGIEGVVRVELIAPDAAVVDSSEQSVHLETPDPGGQTMMSFVCRFVGVNIPTAGGYSVRVLFNGEEKKSLRLTVVTGTSPPDQKEPK
jgi:hypothetical protein